MNRKIIIIGGCVIGVLVVVAAIMDYINPPKRPPLVTEPAPVAVAPETISSITWQQVDLIYNLKSSSTDMQKENAWKGFKGKRVRWSGTVSEVSEGMLGGLSLQVKMNPDTLTSDLLITLKKTEKQNAARLSKGMSVNFSGVLNNWGTIMPITLDDGQIY